MLKQHEKIFYGKALLEIANISYCKKRKVACFIIKNNRIISSGVNGTLPGFNNCCEDIVLECNNCNTLIKESGLKIDPDFKETEKLYYLCPSCENPISQDFIENNKHYRTMDYVLHAEENAILNAAKLGINISGSILYVTTIPCINCAKKIVMLDIKAVYYIDDDYSKDGLNLLKQTNIYLEKVDRELLE